MLRIIQNTSAAGAKSYYSTADYYTEGQELEGHWRGEGAARLGLSGTILSAAWDALCDNRHPQSNEPLTLRRKEERRVGYDFNFHVPKSVSLLYGLTKDERLLDAFRDSVDATMQDMEAEMKTRVRKRGLNEDRVTGNMVWGEFIHFTARPIDGVPDPHLHAHCFVFNSTWDDKENAWKAGQFADLKRDAPYFEAVFHSRLASRLGDLGLHVERKKWGWELAGLDKATIDKFSRRTAQIEDEARKLGDELTAKGKSELGAKTRERKQKNLSLPELRQEWRSRLSDDEYRAVITLADKIGGRAVPEDADAAREAIERSVEHVFERKSVVPERELLAHSLKRSVGRATVATVKSAFGKHDLITAERQGRRMVTTPAIIAEEKQMIWFARNGRGSQRRLGHRDRTLKRTWLNDGQRRAVEHVLASRDRVILVRGAAGVGKTTMMQEAVEAIEANGPLVFTFAPSTAAKSVLQQEGFERADTVARLLVDTKLQEQARGHVVWIDEAGLLGSKAMTQVFELAEQNNYRIVLSGDRKQHGSVERGAALRLLEEEAGLIPAEIREIQRQSGQYKAAVKSLAAGETERGFEQLNDLGWIRETPTGERYRQMATDYIESVSRGLDTLVVSPTHLEGERITAEIRSELKAAKKLGEDERTFAALENVHLTQAERAEPESYFPGDVIVFHQNAKGFTKGQRLVAGEQPLPADQAKNFQVFHPTEIAFARGDKLRVTQNGKTLDGQHRLDNGALYTIGRFDRDGNIVLENGWTVSKDFGHFTHGYCVTSHASQGRTVDRVLIGQSSDSFKASSREQFYVSCSRGRKEATVYTDDRAALLDAVRRSDDRITATELVADRDRQATTRHERNRHDRATVLRQHTVEFVLRPNHLHRRQFEVPHDR